MKMKKIGLVLVAAFIATVAFAQVGPDAAKEDIWKMD